MDEPCDPARLIRPPLDAGELRGELLKSHPHELVEVQTDEGTREYVVTSVRRYVSPGRPTTVRVVGEELVRLELAGGDR